MVTGADGIFIEAAAAAEPLAPVEALAPVDALAPVEAVGLVELDGAPHAEAIIPRARTIPSRLYQELCFI
jgi:hypothetical protein